MTLRTRLLLTLLGLVAVALLIASAVTFTSLRSFLFTRIDQQLLAARQPVALTLRAGSSLEEGVPRGIHQNLPPGTYGELRTYSGTVLEATVFTYGESIPPAPKLPKQLHEANDGRDGVRLFSAGAADSSGVRFRVLVQPLRTTQRLLVVAIPTTEAMQTLTRLVVVEILVSLAVLAALATTAWWLIKRELRPLEAMAETADRIAAGDLTQRVEPAEQTTEVGRLGLSLNTMLAQIERAFAERAATEEKLRRFLADASHELRTPLTSIRGYAELFERGAKNNPEDLATAMRRIEEESGRMSVLVEELLTLARLDKERRSEEEPIDLTRLVEDAVNDARAIDRTRTIAFNTPGAITVTGDELQLRQVAANLLGNALTHTPAGSAIEVYLREEGASAVFEVSDRGPGIPEEEVAKVFEPFYRADPSRTRTGGGAGLGLAIVAAIVAAHNGEATASSREGEGATFSVRLPLRSAADNL